MSCELILIIEDNARNLELVRDVLEFHGFRTLDAADAATGIALAITHRPDLVLMDIQLPGLDGVGAVRQLRMHPATHAVPVVALTAFAMEEDRERFRSAGFDGYISKPIDIKALPDQVRRHCRGPRSDVEAT
jgi:two-component system, cell cycle response regulator DivK